MSQEVDTHYEYHIIKSLRSGISDPFQAGTDCETYSSFLFLHSEAYKIVLAVYTILSYYLFNYLPLVRSLRPFCQDQWMLFGLFLFLPNPPYLELLATFLKFCSSCISGYHFFGFCSGFHLLLLLAFFFSIISLFVFEPFHWTWLILTRTAVSIWGRDFVIKC